MLFEQPHTLVKLFFINKKLLTTCDMKKVFYLFFYCTIYLIGCKQPATSKDQPAKKSMAKSLDLYLPNDLEATLWAESPLFTIPPIWMWI
jgi:hypothetical protein